MTPSKELLDRLMPNDISKLDVPLSQYLADRLAEINKIKNDVWQNQNKVKEAKDKHKKELEKLANEMLLIQKKCGHIQVRHVNGAWSGDGYDECLICLKQWDDDHFSGGYDG